MARKYRQSQPMHHDNSPPSYDRAFDNYQKHSTYYTEDVYFEASDANGVALITITDSPKLA